ncbi:SDR family oxidoreductase [Pelistega europaea]|uniref:SDR family oxidoreductase n=1 Tax=Pelistega europaea TaxID=106147 RepID=A0A7Y4L9K0_9BURK|nr:SDR family oxidoreductase [Pelistega europaea]NOL49475.1 SDR family oxidoreductase [Pelistega europaea]
MRIFITGASSGLGRALAHAYAKAGATLGLVGRREDALRALEAELPGEHKIYVLDVADRDALHAAAYDFQTLGPTDIVLACAGISVGTVTEYLEDFETFKRVYETNVFGLVATFEPFIANMKKCGKGTLVGISSVAGVRGLPGASAYCSSKSAVRTYCESLRVDLYGTGVQVVTIAPGFIDTPMTKVNPYKMPFLMPVDDFAREAVKVIARGNSYKVIPWQMGIVGKLLRLVPNSLYDYFVSKRGRKPRAHEMPPR